MGQTFTSLFITQCNYCNGTGYELYSQSTYCKVCAGYTYMSVFKLPECIKPEQYAHSPRYYEDIFKNHEIR